MGLDLNRHRMITGRVIQQLIEEHRRLIGRGGVAVAQADIFADRFTASGAPSPVISWSCSATGRAATPAVRRRSDTHPSRDHRPDLRTSPAGLPATSQAPARDRGGAHTTGAASPQPSEWRDRSRFSGVKPPGLLQFEKDPCSVIPISNSPSSKTRWSYKIAASLARVCASTFAGSTKSSTLTKSHGACSRSRRSAPRA